jgi:hypothetical protein
VSPDYLGSMKKTIALAMLLLFLFNMGGYYLVFSILKLKAGHELSQRLELQNTDQDETVTVKVPLNLPYPINSTGFERVKGTIKSGNRFFQLVKQKIEHDTLTMVLVQDNESNHIEDVMLTLDKQHGAEKSQEGTLNFSFKLIQDFIASSVKLSAGNAPWSRSIEFNYYLNSLISFNPGAPNPPPKI